MSFLKEIRESWGWCGLKPAVIVDENDFGHLLVRDVQGSYWKISPEDLCCRTIANNREEFDIVTHREEFLKSWQMKAVVQKARRKLGSLEQGRKYHLKTPVALGGSYVLSNIATVPLVEQIRFSGDLGKQVNKLPPGAKIQFRCIG